MRQRPIGVGVDRMAPSAWEQSRSRSSGTVDRRKSTSCDQSRTWSTRGAIRHAPPTMGANNGWPPIEP